MRKRKADQTVEGIDVLLSNISKGTDAERLKS